jgi:predicted metal-dependent hydrolase
MVIDIEYGSEIIPVSVQFEKRQHLAITVHPDLHVTARAPFDRNEEDVKAYLYKRAGWIVKQRDYFNQYQPVTAERRYISGETHYFLGRQYRLRIKMGKKPIVRLTGSFFEMELPSPDDNRMAKTLLYRWYRDHAKRIFYKRLYIFLPAFKQRGINVPEIRLRKMKKRWGSCSKNGVIMLNTELIKTPIHCIDYVLNHELCHLLYPVHDCRFYRLLGRVLPDWNARKERLEKFII